MWYYLLAISALGTVLCVYDKCAAVSKAYRVRESFLYMVGFMGGALTMYITMLLIRHKTRRVGFMVAFPFMVTVHIALFIIYGKSYGYWI